MTLKLNNTQSFAKVPRLPLPDLADTLRRYQEAVEPFISSQEERDSIARDIKALLAEQGEKLQNLVGCLAETHASFISRIWRDHYLENRMPLPIFQNSAALLDFPEAKHTLPLAEKVSILLLGVYLFYKKVQGGTITQDIDRKRMQCMRQYQSLFSTARRPGLKKDFIFQQEQAKHFIILRKGQFFVLPVIDHQDQKLQLTHFIAGLQAVLDYADSTEPTIGILTTLPRSTWALLRARLKSHSKKNKHNLRMIDGAIAVICLDESLGSNRSEDSMAGLCGNAHNRWFDKSMQLICTADGKLAANVEHSAYDGTPILRLCVESVASLELLEHLPAENSISPTVGVYALSWKLPNDFPEIVQKSQKSWNLISAGFHTQILECAWGVQYAKHQKISADFLVQLCLQIAFQETYGYLPSVYESSNMRHFHDGRTETLRPVNMLTKNLLQLLLSGHCDSNVIALIRAASDFHRQSIINIENGQGFDRHLLSLEMIAKYSIEPMPALFKNPLFTRVIESVDISSSAIPDIPGCYCHTFGPAIANGLGIAYVSRAASTTINITSASTLLGDFLQNLEKAFAQVISILHQSGDCR